MERKQHKKKKLFKLIRNVTLAIAIVVVLLGIIRIGEEKSEAPRPTPYELSDFFEEGGRIHYKSVGNAETVIDVSSHNGDIDWQKVAADGIDGAIIRLGYRGHTRNNIAIDEKAEYNLQGAKEAGLKVGGYFFSQAATKQEAAEEAKHCFAVLDGMKLDYPLAYDMEEVHGTSSNVGIMSVEERTECARAFCKKVRRKGYDTMVYGNKRWLDTMINIDELGCKYIWYAQYNNYPEYQWEYAIWQYTESGQVDGINGNVDINLWMK